MNKQKGISTTLSILLVVLLIVVVGGAVVYKYYLAPGEEPSAGETPGEDQDETADWKIYRNEEYGFEVKHPTNWHLYSLDYGGINMMIFSDLSEEQQLNTVINSKVEERKNLCELNNFYFLTIRIVKEPSDNWLKENKAHMDQLGAETLKEEIIIGNIDSYLVTSEAKSGERAFVWVLPKGDNTYLIDSFCPQECRTNWEAGKCKVFTEMLSTFRFLE